MKSRGILQASKQISLPLRGLLRILIPVALLSMFTASCAGLMPRKESSAHSEQDVKIVDPVRYQKAKQMVNQANRLLMKGELQEAETLVNQSLQVHETFEGYYVQGTVFFKEGRTDDALKSFLQAENIRPYDEQLLLSIGVLYTGQGQLEKAQERYNRLHDKYPAEPIYAFKAGTGYKLLKKYDLSYDLLKKADVKGFPYRDQLYLQLGDVALELKKYDESEEYFKKAAELNPSLVAAKEGSRSSKVARVLEQGNAAFKDEKYKEALDLFRSASEIDPGSSAPHIMAGMTLVVLERYDEARKDLDQAVALNPKDPQGYSVLGTAYHRMKDYESALRVLKKGIEIAPESAELYNKLGLVYRDLNQKRFAIDSFHTATRLDSKYLPARINLAYALMEDKRYPEANNEFQDCLTIEKENQSAKDGLHLVEVYTILDRGDRFFQTNQLHSAILEYGKAEKLDDKLPVVHNSLGRAYFGKRDYKSAEKQFQESLKLDEKNVPAIQGLLRVYSIQNRTKDEQKLFARLKELTRTDLTVAITRGRLKEDEGKLGEAKKYYLDLLHTYKDNDTVKRRLGFVDYKLALEANKKGDYQGALRLLKEAQDYNTQIPGLDESLGIIQENIKFTALLPQVKQAEHYYDRRQYDKALPIYERIYDKVKRPLVLVKIATSYMALGQEKKGLRLLEDAASKNSSDVEVTEAIYTYLLKKGEIEKARRGFESILRTHEDAYYSHYKMGIIFLRKKAYRDAIEAFNRSLIFKPDFTVAYVARGVTRYQMGDKDQARADFDQAIQKEDTTPLPRYNIGIMLYNDGLMDKAEAIFKDLIARTPDFPDSYYHLSYIHFTKGNFDAAEEDMKRCIALSPKPEYYYAMAQIYEKRYETTHSPQVALELRAVYRDIITRFPDSHYAEEGRARLLTVLPDSKIVQPYPETSSSGFSPVLLNGNLILVDGDQVQAVSALSRRVIWSDAPGGRPKDLLVDGVVHILGEGHVWIDDGISGARITDLKVDPGLSGRLIGFYDRFGVVSDTLTEGRKNPRQSVLNVYNLKGELIATRKSSGKAAFFASGGDYFEVTPATGGQLQLQKLGADLKEAGGPMALPVKTLDRSLRFYAGKDHLYIHSGDEPIVMVNTEKMKMDGTIALAKGVKHVLFWDVDGDTRILIVDPADSRKLKILDEDGKPENQLDLKEPVYSLSSFVPFDSGNVLYVGTDHKMHMVDKKGEEQWTVDMPDSIRTEGGAYSLFY